MKAKQDWLDTGLVLLASSGAKRLTIDALAERLGLTKGSFYHHFASMGDFERQLVERWAQEQLSAIPRLSKDHARRLAELEAFVDLTFVRRAESEAAMQAWACTDAAVRIDVARVDAARRRYYRSVLNPLLPDPAQLDKMIELLVAILAGGALALAQPGERRAGELFAEFVRLYDLEKKEAQDLQTRLPI